MPPKRVSKRRKNKTTTDEGNTTTACATTTTTADDDKRNTKKKTVSKTIQPGAEKVYVRKKKTKTIEEKSVMAPANNVPPAEPKGSKEGNDKIQDPEDKKRDATGCDPEQMSSAQVANLNKFVEKIIKTGVKGLMDEYESMKSYEATPLIQKSFDANPDKNRYKDKVCMESTRVQLQDSLNGDYIHANLISKAPIRNKFIATQGPLEKTIPDFWRMVVQENVGYIIMLCEFTEQAKEKCAKYYPLKVGETIEHKGITIRLEKTTDEDVFVYSRLIVDAPGKGKRYVNHIKWKDWPDHGVPSNAMPALRLLRHARLCLQPTVVHCSAGVGRTGTLIALEWLLQKICTTPPPYDMKDMIKWIRSQRAHAVQTSSQYAYIAFVTIRLLVEKDRDVFGLMNQFQNEMQTLAGVKMDVVGPSKPTRK